MLPTALRGAGANKKRAARGKSTGGGRHVLGVGDLVFMYVSAIGLAPFSLDSSSGVKYRIRHGENYWHQIQGILHGGDF